MSDMDEKKKMIPEDEEDEEDALEQKKLEEEKKLRKEKMRQRREELRKKSLENSNKDDDPLVVSPQYVAPTVQKPKPALREDAVNNAVNFLSHEKIRPKPYGSKIEYLKTKGLTMDEINEAVARSGTMVPGTSTSGVSGSPSNYQKYQSQPPTPYNAPANYSMPQPPAPYYPPPPPQPSPWYSGKVGFALTAVACLSIGAGISLLAKKYFKDGSTNNDLILEEKKREEINQQNQKFMEEMVNALKTIHQQNSEMKEHFKIISTQLLEKPNGEKSSSSTSLKERELQTRIEEQQSQINNLKAWILDNKTFTSEITPSKSSPLPFSPTTPQKSSIPSWQEDPKENPYSFSKKITQEKEKEIESFDSQNKQSIHSVPRPMEKVEQPYSEKFQAIMEMVSKGEIPPGVKNIDDKPLDPNVKIEKGTKEPPKKPWIQREPTSTTTTTTTTVQTETKDQLEAVLSGKLKIDDEESEKSNSTNSISNDE